MLPVAVGGLPTVKERRLMGRGWCSLIQLILQSVVAEELKTMPTDHSPFLPHEPTRGPIGKAAAG